MNTPMLARFPVLLAFSLGTAAPVAAQTITARSAGAVEIDAVSLLKDVRVLSADSMEGRRTGSDGAERARRYIESRFTEIGLDPVGTGFRHPFEVAGGREGAARQGINLVGRVEGRDPGRVIVVTAHYDHVGVRNGEIFNGADDNASGVAALLAVARSLAANPPSHTVLLVAFDAEESGLQGARAFVAAPPVALETIAINLNFDMVGRNAAGELWVAGTHHYPFLGPFVEELAGRSGVTLKSGHDGPGLPPGDDWTGASDQGSFHAAGIPFLYFGVEDHPDYHRPTDDFERIEPDFLVAAARTLLDAVRTIDQQLDSLVPRRTR